MYPFPYCCYYVLLCTMYWCVISCISWQIYIYIYLNPIWVRLLGQSQLSNPSDLPFFDCKNPIQLSNYQLAFKSAINRSLQFGLVWALIMLYSNWGYPSARERATPTKQFLPTKQVHHAATIRLSLNITCYNWTKIVPIPAELQKCQYQQNCTNPIHLWHINSSVKCSRWQLADFPHGWAGGWLVLCWVMHRGLHLGVLTSLE